MLLNERAARSCIRLAIPPVEYCTDNAAMIAAVGRQLLMSGAQPSIGVEVDSMGAPTLIAMEPRGRDSSDPKKETIYF
jgi:N6-L-threonylcarbamoyladenine synthase